MLQLYLVADVRFLCFFSVVDDGFRVAHVIILTVWLAASIYIFD